MRQIIHLISAIQLVDGLPSNTLLQSLTHFSEDFALTYHTDDLHPILTLPTNPEEMSPIEITSTMIFGILSNYNPPNTLVMLVCILWIVVTIFSQPLAVLFSLCLTPGCFPSE